MLYHLLLTLLSLLSLCNSLQSADLRGTPFLTDSQLNYLALLSNTSHMNEVLDNICVPRVVGTIGHSNVRNYIVSQLLNLGWTVETDSFVEETPIFGELEFHNIIATMKSDAKKYLVLACHYDSKYFKEFDFVAATDSAVPCAMLMNLAYVMQKELKTKKDIDLKLIFLDGEEAFDDWGPNDSLYGARHLASDYEAKQELHKIDLFVLLDLLGARNPSFHNYYKNTRNWFIRLCETELRLAKLDRITNSVQYFHPIPEGIPDVDDDHLPFLAKGVPILHLISRPYPKVWHTEGDNRQVIDMTTTEDLNKILRVFVAEYLHLSVNT